MEVIGDLLARERRSDAPAARDEARGSRDGGETTAAYSYHDLVTTAWKTANFFSHRGVHEGATVAVVDGPAVPAVLSFLGAAQLGAVTRFGPPDQVEADLLVGPGESVLGYDLPAGATRVAYTTGENVEDPSVAAFGRSVWSENPVEPPEGVSPGTPALWTPEGALPHSDLLARAEAAAVDLDPGDEVVVRAPLATVGTVVAGVLAPLLVGATVVFPGVDTVGDVTVATGDAPEDHVVGV
jgi:acyl-CoA synthetase (AMP-forming)/AMP-acid ligase II